MYHARQTMLNVEESDRLSFLPDLFGNDFLAGEMQVYALAEKHITDYCGGFWGTVAKLAMRQPFVLFKGLTFQKLCLPGAFRPGDHHNKMLRPGLCVVHASPQYL